MMGFTSFYCFHSVNFYSKSCFCVTKEEINRPKLQFPIWIDIEKRRKQSVYFTHIWHSLVFFFSSIRFESESIRIADGSKTNDHNHTIHTKYGLRYNNFYIFELFFDSLFVSLKSIDSDMISMSMSMSMHINKYYGVENYVLNFASFFAKIVFFVSSFIKKLEACVKKSWLFLANILCTFLPCLYICHLRPKSQHSNIIQPGRFCFFYSLKVTSHLVWFSEKS